MKHITASIACLALARRLPLLAKRGNTAPIFTTPATIEMTALILRAIKATNPWGAD